MLREVIIPSGIRVINIVWEKSQNCTEHEEIAE
jgi:hypothetical protein